MIRDESSVAVKQDTLPEALDRYRCTTTIYSSIQHPPSPIPSARLIMAAQLRELAEIPRDFLKDGTLFLNRCTKREYQSGCPSLAACADSRSGQA